MCSILVSGMHVGLWNQITRLRAASAGMAVAAVAHVFRSANAGSLPTRRKVTRASLAPVAARVPGQQLSVNICSPESSFTSLVPGSPDSQGTAIHKGHSNGQALLTATDTRLVIKADVIRTCVSPRQICLLHLCYSDR